MPNWKKVIVSGSDASLNSINVATNVVAQSFTGSLQGTASWALNALTSSNVQGGSQYYVPLWNTNSSLTSSYLNQSGSVLKAIYNGQDKGLTLDYNIDSFILGNAGTGNNTYIQVYDGGSVININTPNYTYFAEKVGIRTIPTNPGLAISGALEVTGPGTSKFMNTNVQIDGNLFMSGSNRLIYNDSTTNSMLFGFFDGGNIYGPYYQIFGNQYANTTQRGSAEFVYDNRNGGGSGFNIASFNGSTWTRKFRVDDNGAQVTGSLEVTNGITGSLFGTSSYALDANLLDGKDSTEFATTGSNTFIGDQIVTGSLFTTGSNRLIGTTTLTGSLNITGSTTQIGNNNLFGNTSLSGSVIISGSLGNPTSPNIKIYGDLQTDGVIKFLPVSTNIDTSQSGSYIYVSGATNDLYFSQNGAGYSNVTRLRWLEGNLYTGLLNGGVITSQSSTVYQISSGSGIIVNLNASLSDNPYPTIQYLNWGNLSASISPLTSSYQQAFVGIDSTNNIYQQGTPFSNGQFDTLINIGVVLFQNQSTINGFKTQPSVAYGFEQQQNIFNRAFGPLKLSGFTFAPSGSSTGSLVVGSGTAYSPGANYTINPNEPSYVIDAGTQTSKIFRYYQSGSTWVYLTNGGAGFTTIDPTKYSNDGALTSIPSPGSNWSIQRVFWFPNSAAKAIVVYYGNAYYGTEADAIANINIEPFVEAPNTAANAIYLGAIVIKGNGVFTTATDYKIVPGGLFRQVGGSGGGGSVVTQTLSGLSDVNISGPTNLQPLVYSTTAAKWINNSFISASIYGNAQTATSASHAIESDNAITASYVLNSVSSSFSSTASYVDPLYQAVKISGSLTVTGSTNLVGDTGITLFSANADVLTFTGSIFTSGSIVSVGSLNINRVTSSLFGTSSWAINALTSSYINNLTQDLTISGSVFISGSLTVSGSNTFTNIGPTVFSGSVTSTGGFTGSLEGTATTASYAATASFAATSSFASTASVATSVAGGFSKSFAMINNSNISSNDIGTFQIWRCNVACTASMVLMYQDSGSSVAVNALKNGNALLASDLTNNSLDTWVSSSTLQNQNFAVGDTLAFRLVSFTGSPKEITIQTSFNY